jgi:hypothetical protein
MPNYKTETFHCRYNLINPEKYYSTGRDLVCKSGWEYKFFHVMDFNPAVLNWGYECIKIPYQNPVTGRPSIYYPDIFCKLKNSDGNERYVLIEIKPAKFTTLPKKPKAPPAGLESARAIKYQKRLNTYKSAIADYAINCAKWEAAEKWCQAHGVLWQIVSEKNTTGLFG